MLIKCLYSNAFLKLHTYLNILLLKKMFYFFFTSLKIKIFNKQHFLETHIIKVFVPIKYWKKMCKR